MPFPFYWLGALVAGLLLAGVLTIFGFAFDVVMRATNEVGCSVLPGLVAGFREWTANHGEAARLPASQQGFDPTSPFEEIQLRDGPLLRRVDGRVH